MSAHHHDTHGHGHSHDHSGSAHGSMADYVKGFIWSVILTVIPFAIVMSGGFSSPVTTALVVAGFAVVQMIVHIVYFLHMSPKSEGGWTFTAMIFTILVVVIMLAGSVWVMYHLNANMMPGMMHDTSTLP